MTGIPSGIDPTGVDQAGIDPARVDPGFDRNAAWLRRFTADGQTGLRAFALRLAEAMPERVTIERRSGLFGRSATITGVTVALGDRRYALAHDGARIRASVALVVRGITLQTRDVDPADWFERLARETRDAGEQASKLAHALSGFMAA